MNQCRNCASSDLRSLGFVGKVAPFFLKRVFNLQMHVPVSPHPHKELLRKLAAPFRSIASKLFSNEAYLEMQICTSCSFVQAEHPFPEESINRLYLDYRSESYNRERIAYEPTYAAIAQRVGADPQELANRVASATTFLSGRLPTHPDFTMLDYGGADGCFLPDIPAKKFVYEISNIEPVAGVTRIARKEDLGLFSYVHLAHVLEHVVQPLHLVREVVGHIQPGGFLYIEVPQEIPDHDLQAMLAGTPAKEFLVHEHINVYSIPAITRLFDSVGLQMVAVQADQMNVGWATATHLRALGRKPTTRPKP